MAAMADAVDVVIQTEDIVKRYGQRTVLDGVTFGAPAGALVGIVGENGAGKSTLLKILAGALRPTRGRVLIHGSLGYCPQQVILNESLTVAQHLDYFRAAYRLNDLAYADTLIERLAYGQYRATPVGALSGGTQQKLNLTLALMQRPSVLLLDEPYQGFDWETYLRFWNLANELRDQGCCVVVISHLLFDQRRFDAIYQLREGRLHRQNVAADASASSPSSTSATSSTLQEVH